MKTPLITLEPNLETQALKPNNAQISYQCMDACGPGSRFTAVYSFPTTSVYFIFLILDSHKVKFQLNAFNLRITVKSMFVIYFSITF